MKIYLNELSEEPTLLDFSEKDAWVSEVLLSTQEASPPSQNKLDPAQIHFELRKLQDVVFLKGSFSISLGLLCSRCANDFKQDLSSQFQAMFTREKSLSTSNGNIGVAHSEPTGHQAEDLEMELLEKEYIELPHVLKEQVYLKIPFQPLCREECKGVCPICGQDKNQQPCQCHRIKNTALANALKNIKIS